MTSLYERPEKPYLSASQLNALRHIRERANRRRLDGRKKLNGLLMRADLVADALVKTMEGLQAHAQVVLHFHPDRLTAKGRSVAEALLADGCYRNQYETGISNGSPTAHAGGLRDTLEAALFGGAYHASGVTPGERPKYGALDLFRYADGVSPRFGSCYFMLHASVSARCTFSYGDSVSQPECVGTLDTIECILVALLEQIETCGATLGMDGLTVPALLDYLAHGLAELPDDPASRRMGRVLDDYIEAQVHGPVTLHADVDRLVADPSFRGTRAGEHLEAICHHYQIALHWHPGFKLPVDQIPDDFRGPLVPQLARRIAEMAGTEVLDAAVLGRAAVLLHQQPELWREWGSYNDSLRLLRQLWHVLVQYGVPNGKRNAGSR